jgi:hypothetical protein
MADTITGDDVAITPGTNIEVSTEGDGTILVIRIDLTETQGPSSSGKTILIATTHGLKQVNVATRPMFYLGLTLSQKILDRVRSRPRTQDDERWAR